MLPASIIAAAILLGIVAMSFAFGGGAVIVAIPLALLGLAVIAALEWRRRRAQARTLQAIRDDAKARKVDFTERDSQTLVSE